MVLDKTHCEFSIKQRPETLSIFVQAGSRLIRSARQALTDLNRHAFQAALTLPYE